MRIGMIGLLIALGAAAGRGQTFPTTDPALTPATEPADPTTPKGALIALSRATADGDARAVRGLLNVTNPQEEKLADVLIVHNIANLRFRKAVARAFGDDIATQLAGSALDDETQLARASVALDHGGATVQVDDGSAPINLVRTDGQWKLSLVNLTGKMSPQEVEQRLEQMRFSSKIVVEASDELDHGKYKTPQELRDGIDAKMPGYRPTSSPTTQPNE